MGKLIFVFAFALMALQGSYGASINSSRKEIDDLLEQFLNAIYDVNQVIELLGDDLSSIVRDYERKINEIVEENNNFPVLENLKESINKIESENNDDSKNCVDTAWRMVRITTEELTRGVDNCVSNARRIGGETQSTLKNLDGRANDIRARLITGMHKCMEIGEDVNEVNIKCLRDLIKILNQELADVQKDVEDVNKNIVKITQNGIESLNRCLDQVKEDLALKSKTILDDLERCTQRLLAKPKISTRGLADVIEEIKKKIEAIIDIITNLPAAIAEIPDKIQEIFAKLNIAAIARQLQNEINDIINDGGRDAEDCRPEAEQRINDIVESSEKAAKECRVASNDKLEEIKDQIANIFEKGKQALNDLNSIPVKCALENKRNLADFLKCLEIKYEELKQKVSDLQKEAADLVPTVAAEADEILKSLAQCVNKVQLDTVNLGQVLIKDVEKCVRTIHSFY